MPTPSLSPQVCACFSLLCNDESRGKRLQQGLLVCRHQSLVSLHMGLVWWAIKQQGSLECPALIDQQP